MSEAPKKRWYVVQAFSGFEGRVATSLREHIKLHNMEELFGEVMVPTEEVVEIRGGQRRKSERKFFPGYVLVQMVMNDASWHLVRSVPRVMGFIGGTSDRPAPISDKEVDAIMNRQQQVSDLRIFGVCIGDFLQELRTDDAASTENLRDFAVVQIPVVFFRRSTQLREALSVRNDFAQIQRTTNLLDKLSFVACSLRLRARENFRRGNALIFQRRDITCKHRLGNQRQRFAEIQRAQWFIQQ